jgi:hypothetical protein
MFSNPRAAAVAHDAVLVITGHPPINCADAEYARALIELCAGKTVGSFVHDIRLATQAPPYTMRVGLNALTDAFMHGRDPPPPTVHRVPRGRPRVAGTPPLCSTALSLSDADTPNRSPLRVSVSPSPTKKRQVYPEWAKRPRSARFTKRVKVELVTACENAVESTPVAHAVVARPILVRDTNVVYDIMFDPYMQKDEHIRMWRHALARVFFERFDRAYAFS